MQASAAQIALLIDADNVSALPESRIALIFSKLESLGTVSLRRAYGHWGKPHLKGWAEVLHKYAIAPIQQFNYSAGKNATDIALSIDAMDLFYSGKFESFCIVSCDSDFTPLVVRLRGQGLNVYGFGEYGKTAITFKEACTDFTYLERGTAQLEPEATTATAHSTKSSGQLNGSDSQARVNANDKNGQAEKAPAPASNNSQNKQTNSNSNDSIEPIFHEAVTKNLKKGGWAEAVAVGTYLSRHQKRKADYNTSTWAAYYKKFPRTFEVKTNNGQTLIRIVDKP
ncbi:NYN domain-containing protein [Pseudanabaena sp. FACHB-2040]|uniref:NYN domain-containing protein n=1 Tax=Pseudanabaena sp. FACHB-2040 TaxID=2692859 RepID=UPI001686A9F8|nr:NYN domain-containing protein [Pseudanabaena sp. FACHB-2040]MBD2259739.1 NYN domain-containing protein [Pseudanabaena sp. FACHB-2040]